MHVRVHVYVGVIWHSNGKTKYNQGNVKYKNRKYACAYVRVHVYVGVVWHSNARTRYDQENKKIKSMHVHMCVCTYMWVLYGTAMEEPDIIKEIRTKI